MSEGLIGRIHARIRSNWFGSGESSGFESWRTVLSAAHDDAFEVVLASLGESQVRILANNRNGWILRRIVLVFVGLNTGSWVKKGCGRAKRGQERLSSFAC